MADSESSSVSALLSPNTIMAVITLVGGFLIVTHPLSSDRPRRPATDGTEPLGYQNIESRLWEDPFAAWNKLSYTNRAERRAAGLSVLAPVLTNALPVSAPTNVLVLAVMVSGGPYAEDTESRVRCRYAVGAALGVGGYKPAEAGHIGLAAADWQNTKALESWKRCTNATLKLSPQDPGCSEADGADLPLVVPFEQYDIREFYPREDEDKPPMPSYGRVLLLWLDEDCFSDEPAARLAALFEQVKQSVPSLTDHGQLQQAVIGPRASSTLRTLMASVPDLRGTKLPWTDIARTLHSVRLILATPTAMDELLVKPGIVPTETFKPHRGAVTCALEGTNAETKIFQSVANFACTDAKTASEAIEELKLRGIDPAANTNQHIVLISEWDTFFSRVSSIAFAAELSKRLANPTNNYATSAVQFVEQVRGRTNAWPPMLHRFVYLQGLDGEAAVDGDTESTQKKSKQQHSEKVDAVPRWTPDVNKAEGSAQLDYLTRLAEVLEDVNQRLWREPGRGRIAAVGIVGSDVYDTLLILQALRPRLPDVVFFTTDLDARYSDPRELKWSRNLVILSGYGLRLREDLQCGVAPFRDSAQSAQFLATLNALGRTNLFGTGTVRARRFEIGRGGPVNLSVDEGGVHPPIRRPMGSLHCYQWATALGVLVISGLVLWKRARQMAFASYEYRCQPLAVTEEDLGGTEGLRHIVRNLEARRANDALADWMMEEAPQYHREASIVAKDITDFPSFITKLKQRPDDLWSHVANKLSAGVRGRVNLYSAGQSVSDSLKAELVIALQKIVDDQRCIFEDVHINQYDCWRAESELLREQVRSGQKHDWPRLNRMLLEDAFSCELVRRVDEEWIGHCAKSLIAKLNALVFFPKDRWPDGPAMEKGDLLNTELGRRWAKSANKVRERGEHRLTAADAYANRQAVNDILIKLGRPAAGAVPDANEKGELDSASESARQISLLQYKRRNIRPLLFWITASLFAGGCLAWACLAKYDTFDTRTGEPFNFAGTSAWPAEFFRWSVLALSVLVIIRTQLRLGESILQISRRYRLQTKRTSCWRARWLFRLPEPPLTEYEVDANQLWNHYQQIRHWFPRSLRVLICVSIYMLFGLALMRLTVPAFSPVRGHVLITVDGILLISSVLAFLIVTFWIIDAARCCAWFIRRLSQAPTQYPRAALEHFTRQRAIDDPGLVEEWIDLQLIADLTEPVGRLVYWPFVAVFLLFVARNPWWDHWVWHWPLLVIFGINMVLAAASSIILQNAAREARKTGVQRLKAKVHEKHRQSSTLEEHESDQAESLLEEITNLRRGAFAPLSKNPLIGALLVNSSGVVLLELLAQFYFK